MSSHSDSGRELHKVSSSARSLVRSWTWPARIAERRERSSTSVASAPLGMASTGAAISEAMSIARESRSVAVIVESVTQGL